MSSRSTLRTSVSVALFEPPLITPHAPFDQEAQVALLKLRTAEREA
jgi:hypothetical protein